MQLSAWLEAAERCSAAPGMRAAGEMGMPIADGRCEPAIIMGVLDMSLTAVTVA